jgi:chromosome segregation ATPase
MEKHKEVEVLEKRLEVTEKRESHLREELEELKEVYEVTRSETGAASDETAGLKRRIVELTTELEAMQANLTAEVNARNKEAARCIELKKKCDDAMFEKKRMEYEVKEIKRQTEEENERYRYV